MTITDAIRSIHRTHAATRLQEAEIGLVRFRLNQAEAESHALETALTMWEVLFSRGEWQAARRQWALVEELRRAAK